jgi:transposase
MIPVSGNARIWLALGHTDMRRGMRSLALQVQQALRKDVHTGDLFVFRGRSGSLCKILWHDGIAMSLYIRRLERGGSSGRQQRKEQWRSRPRHWHVCSKGSTGARRRKPGARHRLVDALSPHSGAFLKGEMALKMAKMLEF